MNKALPWMVLSLLLGSGLLFQTISSRGSLKTAYVTNAKLYTEFLLAKELDAKLKNVQTTRQAILDSLELQLNALGGKLSMATATSADRTTFNELNRVYSLKQQQFVEDNAQLTQRYQEQIATQLNQYLKDFTEEHDYDYIFGATGAGSLMGAKEHYDVTNAVLTYANDRYKGSAK